MTKSNAATRPSVAKTSVDVDLLVAQGLVGQARVHLLDLVERHLEAVLLLEAGQAIGTAGELGVERQGRSLVAVHGLGEVAQRLDAGSYCPSASRWRRCCSSDGSSQTMPLRVELLDLLVGVSA